MTEHILSIIEMAYRTTLEEQNDTVLWLNTMLCDQGLCCNVLLRGNAVHYAINRKGSATVTMRTATQTLYVEIIPYLQALIDRNMQVYVARDDIEMRGASCEHDLMEGIQPVTQVEIIQLMHQSRQIWYW